jgi:hypothetical protein
MKKILIFLLFFIITPTVKSSSSIKKYFGSSEITFDEIGIINFLRYLEGTFYAEDISLERAARNMSPMYYAVSEDGKIGYGWFCQSYKPEDCTDDFVAFKVVEYCKEYAQQQCFIFASKNEIVWNNISLRIKESSFQKSVELFKKLNFYKPNSLFKVNENNYLNYVHLSIDKCISKRQLDDYSNLRGANLNCLLPGRYEQITNNKFDNN